MTSPEQITLIVEHINNRANDILLKGGGDEELLLSLHDIMGELKKVMDTSTNQELDGYCQKYNGFYRYARLLEKLSEDMADGTINI